MHQLEGHGVGVDVPAGWEAELSTVEEDQLVDAAVSYAALPPRILLHAGNFALPVDRGDYGSGAVEVMDSGSVLVVVMEFDRASASTALFAAEGLPTDLRAEDFSTQQLQRPQRNQSGVQRFFHIGQRAFCLYVVLGSHLMRAVLVEEANRIVRGLRIDA
jgi:hypothetical protein